VDGLLLSVTGALAGVLMAHLMLRILVAIAPASLSRLESARVNGTVMAFAMLASLACGVLFSLAPAVELWRERAIRSLQPHWRSMAPVRHQTRSILVALQIAISLVLLVGAGLLVRAFVAVQNVEPGFRADRRLTFRVAVPESRYGTSQSATALSDELLRRFRALPGVRSAGAMSHLPYDDLPNWALAYSRPSVSTRTVDARADTRSISPGLFEALDVQRVDGRFFADAESEPSVVIDDGLAASLWPNATAVGQQLLVGQAAADRRVTVVGVIRHLRHRSLIADVTPQIYLPYGLWPRNPMAYVLETDGDSHAVIANVKAAVFGVDPKLPIYDVRPLQSYVDAALSTRRFVMSLAAVFAGAALALTGLGVYGLLAYAVATRRQEFGVRRALGADGWRVIAHVGRESLGLTVVGCTAGLVIAFWLARLIENQLYGVEPHDPLTFGAALVLIVTAAVMASCIPVRRALSVQPAEALQPERMGYD
jgi:predicted permease